VHNGICNANPTIDKKVIASIRAAWQTMMGGVEIKEIKDPATGIMRQETVQEAFMRMNEEGTG
jgi:hypothetical protein